ncbi:MAG: Mut7-C RNAse domain-containing protein, partial [Proteobacteria bacterium]|nr:Mut7-C RNAse domain-containing protein [Pseudomonadota bacterium]
MSIKFIADVMLGKLAKWLRILGIDTLYSSSFDDKEIIFLAVNESRIVLTRDNRLQKDLGNKKSVLIKSDNLFEQLSQVIDTFNLK